MIAYKTHKDNGYGRCVSCHTVWPCDAVTQTVIVADIEPEQFDDLPIAHVFPNGTPSDAELAAERDVKYQALLAHEAKRGCGCTWPCACDEWPVGEVAG